MSDPIADIYIMSKPDPGKGSLKSSVLLGAQCFVLPLRASRRFHPVAGPGCGGHKARDFERFISIDFLLADYIRSSLWHAELPSIRPKLGGSGHAKKNVHPLIVCRPPCLAANETVGKRIQVASGMVRASMGIVQNSNILVGAGCAGRMLE